MDSENIEIKEDFYSRQLYTYGAEAMKNMACSNVLFIGLKSLGIEIAKNVVLSGVKSCTFYENDLVQIKHLSSHFFLNENDVGKCISELVSSRIQELNPLVYCSSYKGELSKDFISQFTVIVCTDISLRDQIKLNELTRSCGVRFISATTAGLFGSVFTDFGENFVVFDVDGEEPKSKMISYIDEKGNVSCIEEQRHELISGDYVTFSEIVGMTELNNCPPIEIKVIDPYTFSIGNVTEYSNYVNGGLFHQVKMPKKLNFESLSEQLLKPEILPFDFAKLEKSEQLHIGFQTLDVFVLRYGRNPIPKNVEDMKAFYCLAEELNSNSFKKIELDKEYLLELCSQSTGDIPPIQSVIGGFTAQEVMKATSKKFLPLKQFFYFDSLESLPSLNDMTESECSPMNCRYDGQIAVFGKTYLSFLSKIKPFLVGAGAIGCELLKNWALMGIGSSEESHIVVTDMDSIEKSNLNRQFLFRSWDLSQPKSVVASSAAKRINPSINITTYQEKVGEDSEHIFDDDFFDRCDVIVNALDNVEARRYIDRRCVFYSKPLLENGTLGTKGNTQVILPYLTESYSSTQDPPEKSIPMCTIKNFPSAIEHTIQWARETFEEYFVQKPSIVNQFLENDLFLSRLQGQSTTYQRESLETILKYTTTERLCSFQDCIYWAHSLFQEFFFNRPSQLLHNFPPNILTASGIPFWSSPKRCPTPLIFDHNNELHFNFIIHSSNLIAEVFQVETTPNVNFIKEVLSKIHAKPFVPRDNIKIQVNDNETNEVEPTDAGLLTLLIEQLPKKESSLRMNPLTFEKDDDSKFHIDYITCCSNLRAETYGIKTASRLKTRGIAGKIIPAVATTTSLIAGLCCLEFYKVAFKKTKIEDYKCGFVNLALPFVTFSEPIAAPKAKCQTMEFTLWDRIDIDGGLLLKDFIQHIESKYKINVMIISCGVSMLFALFMAPKKRNERLQLTVEKVIESSTATEIPKHIKSLTIEVLCSEENGEDIDFPFIRYFIKH